MRFALSAAVIAVLFAFTGQAQAQAKKPPSTAQLPALAHDAKVDKYEDKKGTMSKIFYTTSEEDKKKRELIDARNQGEALVHSTEKNLKEFGDKVGAPEKSAIESALADLKGVLTGEDTEAIKSKTNDLAQAAMKLGEAMYKAQQAAGAAAAEADAKKDGAGDDVVDADFKEVDGKDDKKKSA